MKMSFIKVYKFDLTRGARSFIDELQDQLKLHSFESTTTTDAPFIVNSTARVDNLNVQYLDGKDITKFVLADGSSAFTNDLDLTNHKIINLKNPDNAQDAATKAYVDSVAAGLDPKESVKLATVSEVHNADDGNGSLTVINLDPTNNRIDDVDLVVGDRILIKDESNLKLNGIYVIDSIDTTNHVANVSRSADMNGDPAAEVSGGNFTFVGEGSTNAGSGWDVLGNGVLTIGTDDIVWTQFSGAGQITAGVALSKNGNIINTNIDDVTIGIDTNNELIVKDNSISNAKLTQNSVGTENLIGGSVTPDKLNAVAGNGLDHNATDNKIEAVAADGTITVDNTGIKVNIVDNSNIADNAITGGKISDGEVSAIKLATDVADINNGLQQDATTHAIQIKLGDATLKLDANGLSVNIIQSGNIANNAVSNVKIEAAAVNVPKIDFGTGTDQVNAEVIPIKDADGNFTTDNVEAALAELATTIGAGTYFTNFSDGTNQAVADNNSDTLTLKSSNNEIDIVASDTDDSIDFNIANDSITADKITSNVDVSSKGFNADKVDGKDVDDSVTVPSNSILWSAKHALKLGESRSDFFFVSNALDGSAGNTISDQTITEGATYILGYDATSEGFAAGDIVECIGGAWEVVGNIVNNNHQIFAVPGNLTDYTSETFGLSYFDGSDFQDAARIIGGGDSIHLQSNIFTNHLFAGTYSDFMNVGDSIQALGERIWPRYQIVPNSTLAVNDMAGLIVSGSNAGYVDKISAIESDAVYDMVGVVKAIFTDPVDNTVTWAYVQTLGTSTNVVINGTLNNGDKLYVDPNNAGQLTNVIPSASGQVIRLVLDMLGA
jgi:hypothetical protein